MKDPMERSRSPLLAPALLAVLAVQAHGQVPTSKPGPVRRDALSVTVTPVLGTDETASPGVLIADLDAGDFVAGRTWWEFQPGVVYVETFLGFFWSPADGMSVFTVPLDLYFQQLITFPNDIADDRTVVGGVTVTTTFQSLPFAWTPASGVVFLPTPPGWTGSAAAVSADGSIVGGNLLSSLFAPPQAVRWTQGVVQVMGPAGQYSVVADASDDGSVLVGDIGPDAASAQATRWVDGVELGLAAVPGASSSSAHFVSDDGTVVIGRAVVGTQELVVRWVGGAAPATFTPPNGLLIETINAINPDATAAVGALSDDHTFAQGNWDPFLWRLSDGFTILDELGLSDTYDLSEATDVSDDGTRVVGDLRQWVHGPGSPPPLAFLWTPTTGTRDLELLQQSAGGSPLGLFTSTAISGDGNRILATGIVQPSPEDTSAVILAFQGLP